MYFALPQSWRSSDKDPPGALDAAITWVEAKRVYEAAHTFTRRSKYEIDPNFERRQV
jgi:hypothetical protein